MSTTNTMSRTFVLYEFTSCHVTYIDVNTGMPLDIGICLTNPHVSRTYIWHTTDASTGTPLDIGTYLTNLYISRTNICHVTYITHIDASTGTPLDIGICLTNPAPATNWIIFLHVESLLFTLNAFSLHSKLRQNEREKGREREGERILLNTRVFRLKSRPDEEDEEDMKKMKKTWRRWRRHEECFSNDNTYMIFIPTNAHKHTRTYTHSDRGNEHGVARIRDELHVFDLNVFSTLIFYSERQGECACWITHFLFWASASCSWCSLSLYMFATFCQKNPSFNQKSGSSEMRWAQDTSEEMGKPETRKNVWHLNALDSPRKDTVDVLPFEEEASFVLKPCPITRYVKGSLN